MSNDDKIMNCLIKVLSKKFGISKEITIVNSMESLNGDVFQFDAISMVYFILELQEKFGIKIRDTELQQMTYWSPQDFAQYLATVIVDVTEYQA